MFVVIHSIAATVALMEFGQAMWDFLEMENWMLISIACKKYSVPSMDGLTICLIQVAMRRSVQVFLNRTYRPWRS